MLDTIGSMIVPIVVLLVLGSLIIGLAWWLAVQAEGKDEWMLGGDEAIGDDPAEKTDVLAESLEHGYRQLVRGQVLRRAAWDLIYSRRGTVRDNDDE